MVCSKNLKENTKNIDVLLVLLIKLNISKTFYLCTYVTPSVKSFKKGDVIYK